MYFDLELADETKDKINELINEEIENSFRENSDLVKKIVTESIKGSIKSRVNEILQSDKFRTHLRDEIMKQLNIGEGNE